MNKREKVIEVLDNLNIDYEIHEHPPVPTVEEALPYWKKIDATHCKNLFFRNHKGNRHYLVILRARPPAEYPGPGTEIEAGENIICLPAANGEVPGLIGWIRFCIRTHQ